MKMSDLEKLFVNSSARSQQVSNYAEKMLQLVDIKAGRNYLDFGCGNGAAAIDLAAKYPLDVTGIDVDPEQIQLAQDARQCLSNIRFITVDGTHLPFEDGEFDIVFTNNVTHHIPNWLDAVAEMIRVVKPGGYLIYADGVVPSWLANVGRRILKRTGFPTVEGLESLLNQKQLYKIHTSITPVRYEVVLQKS